jgi:molybdate transport repressor ModE-like protein/molybdopterin-binding protein
VRVRPDEVVLCAGHPGRVSARNVLPGHVRAVRSTPDGVVVTLDVGFPLASLVTRAAVVDLRIRRGAALYAMVKANAVVPDVRVEARVRVSLVGPHGELGADRIDLLRAIDATGSLSAAARELGVTYRTAWAWAEAANRAWGEPLVARVHGGRGGGGATLTPAGRAVADRAEGAAAGRGSPARRRSAR